MGLIDLTQTFADGMFGLSTLPPISVTRQRTIAEHGVNVTLLGCSVHSGTHVDAPCHFIEGGRDASQLSLEDASGDAVCLDVPAAAEDEITRDRLERAARDLLRRGDIVLIHTGFGRFFTEDPERYKHHPFLSPDAAAWLVERGARMVALDIPTPDRPEWLRPPGFDFPVHKTLLGSGVLVAEHLANLDRVAGRRMRVYAFPLPIRGGDGSPVRFVAEA